MERLTVPQGNWMRPNPSQNNQVYSFYVASISGYFLDTHYSKNEFNFVITCPNSKNNTTWSEIAR